MGINLLLICACLIKSVSSYRILGIESENCVLFQFKVVICLFAYFFIPCVQFLIIDFYLISISKKKLFTVTRYFQTVFNKLFVVSGQRR